MMHPSLDFPLILDRFSMVPFLERNTVRLKVFVNCPSESGLRGARAVCLMPLVGDLCGKLLRPSQSPDLQIQKNKKALGFL